MSPRVKTYSLAALLLLLAWVLVRELQDSRQVIAGQAAGNFKPIAVDDPTLRIDDIAASQKREYQGQGRNVFKYGAQRPTVPPTVAPGPVGPDKVEPAPPPPLTAPFKYYGLATNPATGRRRAFFTNGDDIWIVEEGQMIDRRFRLLSIGSSNAEVEEVSSGKRVTLPLEELPGASSQVP